MSDFAVRRAQLDDAPAVADVWLASRTAALAYIPAPAHAESAVRAWVAERVLTDGECWVAQASDGEIIGMLATAGTWIEQLYVSLHVQRSGIGTALLDVAKRRAPGPLQLWTFQTNVHAQRFYERHSFVCVERTDGSDNEERAPDMRYVFTPVRA